MNTQTQPPDVAEGGTSPAHNPTGNTPHGIPKGQENHEATATPTDDRSATETAVVNSGKK